MTNVIDISKWQSTYDADTAKAAGINEVILRCAYGTSKDVKFDEFYTAATAAGQTVGAYGFATWHYSSKNGGNLDAARAVMVEQIAAWIAICKDKLDGYFAIDQELESGYTMGLTPSDNEILLNEATALLEDAGFVVCVYCSVSWAMSQFNKDNINADLWLAYYPSDYASVDFADAPNYESMSGTYYSYMQSCGDQLCGWQFGSTGWGAKYGCGSDNLDRNLFYRTAQPTTSYEAFSAQPVQLICGYASVGDVATIENAFAALQIATTTANGFVISDVAVSSGDQRSIIALCANLVVPCAVYTAPEAEALPETDSETLPEAEALPETEGESSPETESEDATATPPAPEQETTPDVAVSDEKKLVNTLLALVVKLLDWIYTLLNNKA